jgi:hypothetical protein
MLTLSYRAYIGFIGYLYAYIPNRKERKGKGEQQQKEKNTSRKKHKINTALINKRMLFCYIPIFSHLILK